MSRISKKLNTLSQLSWPSHCVLDRFCRAFLLSALGCVRLRMEESNTGCCCSELFCGAATAAAAADDDDDEDGVGCGEKRRLFGLSN